MPKELVVKEDLNELSDISAVARAKHVHKRLSEGIFILVFALSLFMSLSLLSYEKMDPCFFGVACSTHHVIQSIYNSGGWVGAYVADFLLYLLGFLAYCLPIILVYLAWIQLYPDRHTTKEPQTVINGVGALLLILGAAGLGSFEFFVPVNILPHTAGGIVGDLLSKGLDIALNPQGTVLLLVAFCFIGVTLLTGLSWVITAETIGLHTLLWLQKVASMSYAVIERSYRHCLEKMQTRRAKKAEKTVVQQEPRGPRIDDNNLSVLSEHIAPPKVTVGNIGEKMVEKAAAEVKPMIKPIVPVTNPVAEKSRIFSAPLLPPKAVLPSLNLLEPAEKISGKGYTSEQLEGMAREVEQRLLDFGIEVQVVAVHPGPVITRFELQLAPGVKVSRITGLAKDLARALSVISVRVVDVIPGKPVIGLELPNKHREMVRLSEIFLTDQFQQALSPICMALGVDIAGYPVVVDLAKMPHLLVAGTTGSGKSVGLNAMLLSILFKATPEEVRLILVDPKMLEFSIYDRIPHLLTPVVTDMKEAAGALRWSVAEMERRYRLMSSLGVRNLAAYNLRVKEAEEAGEPLLDPLWRSTQDMQTTRPALTALPYIVVVIDELADMMMVVGKKVEQLIARIAQKARAAGIHLILATQRPSVDVLTGLIKSNIPTRIAFQVSSKIDSRTILDQQGADQLLGHGDMLYLTPGSGAPVRIHGAFVDDKEVHRVADAWRALGDPQYVDILPKNSGEDGDGSSDNNGDDVEDADPLYDEAVGFVTQTRKASISSVQRRFKVGYNRAARLIEEMERTGVVSAMESNGVRDVLAPPPPSED